jgi:hypothetical protein
MGRGSLNGRATGELETNMEVALADSRWYQGIYL